MKLRNVLFTVLVSLCSLPVFAQQPGPPVGQFMTCLQGGALGTLETCVGYALAAVNNTHFGTCTSGVRINALDGPLDDHVWTPVPGGLYEYDMQWVGVCGPGPYNVSGTIPVAKSPGPLACPGDSQPVPGSNPPTCQCPSQPFAGAWGGVLPFWWDEFNNICQPDDVNINPFISPYGNM